MDTKKDFICLLLDEVLISRAEGITIVGTLVYIKIIKDENGDIRTLPLPLSQDKVSFYLPKELLADTKKPFTDISAHEALQRFTELFEKTPIATAPNFSLPILNIPPHQRETFLQKAKKDAIKDFNK